MIFSPNKKENINRLLIFTVLCLSLFFQSCVSQAKQNLDRLKKCEFQLVNVLVSLTPGQRFSLIPKFTITPIIEIKNPNEEDVTIYQFDLNLSLLGEGEEEKLGRVKNSEPKTVAKHSSITLPLTLDLEQKDGFENKILSVAMRLLNEAGAGKDAEFLIEGNVTFDTGFGKIPLPVSERQNIKLKK
ncbi:hypothetical protein LPTSP3_g01580 [Leptospira kobayashii]|uniref:Late embryogenesis abundant protein n=1 Tax=Leptospira kobayashii TaxID=1917830 RepID=A0ABM7UFB6_9LEPT|nr:LEA type 2 family protein [Leptospira kobayashii]BDA77228.1 hypothetical protein LPTSP3_g01580 [Leptospira kobayashii]